ncbi:MAG: 30S ribosomal protein S20 [Gammaproteobacteria bacterium]|jgi:small subunit ribosomal protein S20|nr:30S ribosomal protein S20 [Gammaproteobacteria bacterium]MBT7603642.1 30S ribosomal protein S20 [Gammaproteobacteria bacterium]
MANTAQARKRVRQSVVRRERNVALKSKLRTFVKNVVKAIDSGDKALAGKNYKVAIPIIDSSVSKGIIHKNKAARYKSRLNKQILELS